MNAKLMVLSVSPEWSWLNACWLASDVLLWIVVVFLCFLLLGSLRAMGRLQWRLEQLEAITPSRLGRSGLRLGKKAPEFTLASVSGSQVSLHQFAGRKVLVVFTQTGCEPCQLLVPELNSVQADARAQVLMVNNGQLEAARKWAGEIRARFPVLVQENLSLSKRYEILATPFAFLIDEKGVIASKGICNSKQHIGFVLAGRRAGQAETEPTAAEEGDSRVSISSSNLGGRS
jgi:methylamine dehydrogenase accessory protein MauD